jgi:uncharacterized OsmC-like protein
MAVPTPTQTSGANYRVVLASGSPGVGVVATKNTTVEFDRSWGGDASDELPGPAELLASSFGACIVKNVERFSQILKLAYDSVTVEVTIHRVDAPPHFDKIDYTATIVTAEPPRRVELLHRNLKKHGTVFNTLAAACEISGNVIAVEPTR